jgi:hypothetical protein
MITGVPERKVLCLTVRNGILTSLIAQLFRKAVLREPQLCMKSFWQNFLRMYRLVSNSGLRHFQTRRSCSMFLRIRALLTTPRRPGVMPENSIMRITCPTNDLDVFVE